MFTCNKRQFSTSPVNHFIDGDDVHNAWIQEYDQELHSNPVGLPSEELQERYRNDPEGLETFIEERRNVISANTAIEARVNTSNLANRLVEREDFEFVADHIASEHDRMLNEVERTRNEVKENLESLSDYQKSLDASTNQADSTVATTNQTDSSAGTTNQANNSNPQSPVDWVMERQAEEQPGYGWGEGDE